MDYDNWGPADWLAVVLVGGILIRILIAVCVWLGGAVGLIAVRAFSLGKGPRHEGIDDDR